MAMQKSVSWCVEALESLRSLVSAKRWKSLAKAEKTFNTAFSQLRHDIAGQALEVNDQQTVKNLEQQVRRIQREIRMEMGGISEKLDWLDTEKKRTGTTFQHLDSNA